MPTDRRSWFCPGGAYTMLAEHEAEPIARWLNTFGVTGIVLKYRLGPRYHHPAPLIDVSRAIRTVRAKAAEWKLDAKRVGVMGFSAEAGHLFGDRFSPYSIPIRAMRRIRSIRSAPGLTWRCWLILSSRWKAFRRMWDPHGNFCLGDSNPPARICWIRCASSGT